MNNDQNQFSRTGYRSKRKKTNLILNSLIVIVLLLIIVVAYNIFAPSKDKAAVPKKESAQTEAKQNAQKDDKKDQEAEEATAKEETTDQNQAEDQDQAVEDQQSEETSSPASETDSVVTDGGSTPNVIKTIENQNWKPVGTTQTGEHTAVYDQNAVDWKEMLNAISYATDLPVEGMTVYWLGRDSETPNGSRGTVYSKETQKKFRVFIQWIDGEGWKPTKVEELAELEK